MPPRLPCCRAVHPEAPRAVAHRPLMPAKGPGYRGMARLRERRADGAGTRAGRARAGRAVQAG
jgi:hypothetical protein